MVRKIFRKDFKIMMTSVIVLAVVAAVIANAVHVNNKLQA